MRSKSALGVFVILAVAPGLFAQAPPKPPEFTTQRVVRAEIRGNLVFITREISYHDYQWNGTFWVPYIKGTKSVQVGAALGSGQVPLPLNANPAIQPQIQAVPQMNQFVTRYVEVQNGSGEPIEVFLQYEVPIGDGNWVWVPGPPELTGEGKRVEIGIGGSNVLMDGAWAVKARRVRWWARSASGREWANFKGQDDWTSPGNGYFAAQMETYPIRVE